VSIKVSLPATEEITHDSWFKRLVKGAHMVARTQLVQQLEQVCPPADPGDRSAIIAALERGDSEGAILFMPEVFRWPDTYHWLKTRLCP
jgi:DNA-binding GntR family transcriptional regulator